MSVTKSNTNKFQSYNHDKFLEIALKTYLITDKNTNCIAGIKNQKELCDELVKNREVLAMGEDVHFRKESTGNMVRLSENNVKLLIEQAFKRFPIYASPQKVRDWKSMEEQFRKSCEQLKRQYNLKELAVAPPFTRNEDAPTPIGNAAGTLFNRLVDSASGEPKVGIGGGRTLRDMAPWISLAKPFLISPINYTTRVPEEKVYDSSYLAMHIHWLCQASKAKIISIPPLPRENIAEAARWHSNLFHKNPDLKQLFEETSDPDIVFVGAGRFLEDSPTMTRVYQHLGIGYDKLSKMMNPPVGDINLCFFDKGGNDITGLVMAEGLRGRVPESEFEGETFFKNHDYCHPFLVGMNIKRLKELVAAKKTVVLVAGGDGGAKEEVIRVCIKKGIVNALVTDAPTMERLLEKKVHASK